MTGGGRDIFEAAPYKVLYDGNCQFCLDSMETLRKLDAHQLTEPLPLSQDMLYSLRLPITMDQCLKRIHVVSAQGELLVGYDAIVRLSLLFPQTRWLGKLALVCLPRCIGDRLYRMVASSRYKLSRVCKDGFCHR